MSLEHVSVRGVNRRTRTLITSRDAHTRARMHAIVFHITSVLCVIVCVRK